MIITICGSCTFAEEMGETAQQLREKGHTVHTPEPLVTEEWYKQNYGRKSLLEMKPVWTKRHFEKIQNSDAVLILNCEKKGIKGYFGSNTLMELSVAFYLDKKIFFLNQIGEDHPHYEEIFAIEPHVLGGELNYF